MRQVSTAAVLIAALSGMGALAGCSTEPATQDGGGNSIVPTERVSTTVERTATAPPANGVTGTGLTAQVSDLTGAVSGLNTRLTDMGLVIDLPADALFDFDKATLTPAAETELNKAAELIRRSPAGPIQVIGHTDAKGDDAYNQTLSEARARTVADWFGQQVGVRQRQFEVSGKGETAPIAPNAREGGADDAAGRARNRRVEVIVPKP